MKKYVLVSRSDERITAILREIAPDLDFEIVDESGAHAVLAKATEEAVLELQNRMPDWVISEESDSGLPNPAKPGVVRRKS